MTAKGSGDGDRVREVGRHERELSMLGISQHSICINSCIDVQDSSAASSPFYRGGLRTVIRCPAQRLSSAVPLPEKSWGGEPAGKALLLSASYQNDDHLLSTRSSAPSRRPRLFSLLLRGLGQRKNRGSPPEGIRLSGRRAGAGCVWAWRPPGQGWGRPCSTPAWRLGAWPGAQLPCISRWRREAPLILDCKHIPVPTPLVCSVAAPPSPVRPFPAPPLHN